MVNWIRAVVGLTIVGLGMAVFFGVALPVDQRMSYGLRNSQFQPAGL
jgi:hypothetical protein